MQTGKNDTNDKKFANLATENYGRKCYQHKSNDTVSLRIDNSRRRPFCLGHGLSRSLFLSIRHYRGP